MKASLLLLIAIFISAISTAQNYKGVVKNQNGDPVEYVRIGIKSGNTGTVSNESGEFELPLNDSLNNRKLLFTRIGYKPYEVSVLEFKQTFSGLVEIPQELHLIQEVVVTPKRYRETTINERGIKLPGLKAIAINSQERQQASELGQLGFEVGNIVYSKKTFIPQTLQVDFASCDTPEIVFRVNVYEVGENYLIGECVNNKEIFFTVRPEQKSYSIDLSSENLYLQGTYFFCIEMVTYAPTKSRQIFSVPMHTSNCYIRYSSHGELEERPFNIGIKITAKVER